MHSFLVLSSPSRCTVILGSGKNSPHVQALLPTRSCRICKNTQSASGCSQLQVAGVANHTTFECSTKSFIFLHFYAHCTTERKGKSVLLLKPALDTRFGADLIASRAGLERHADVVVHPSTNILNVPLHMRQVSCVLVDEAQFLLPAHVDQLRMVTSLWMVPVVCEYSMYIRLESESLWFVLCGCAVDLLWASHRFSSRAVSRLETTHGACRQY